MGSIAIEFREHLLYVKGSGVLKSGDVRQVIREHYPHLGSRNVVWDLREADISSFTIEELKGIAEVAKGALQGTRFARVVYIGVSPALFHKMCLYTAIASMAETPADYAVFQSEEEALNWLQRHSVTVETAAPMPAGDRSGVKLAPYFRD